MKRAADVRGSLTARAAIILSCHTIGLAVIRALGTKGVPILAVHFNKTDMGQVSRYVNESFAAPHPEGDEERFLALLEDLADRYPNSLLIPADDPSLVVVSRNKARLSRRLTVGCTDWAVTEKFIDKKMTYALAKELGIPIPKTVLPESENDIVRHGESIGYPLIVKPCVSHSYYRAFRRKLVLAENCDQLVTAYRDAAEIGIEMMLQEYIPGDDGMGANYNSYFWEGEPLVEFTAEKVRLSPSRFGIPSVVVSKHVPEVIEPGRSILRAMGFSGYSCTEFKKDVRDGVYKLMEVNGRHNRSASLSLACGINFPWLQYRHLLHGELPVIGSMLPGVYWIDEFKDAFAVMRCLKNREAKLAHCLQPYLRSNVFSVFDISDVKPFLKRCGDALRTMFLPASAGHAYAIVGLDLIDTLHDCCMMFPYA